MNATPALLTAPLFLMLNPEPIYLELEPDLLKEVKFDLYEETDDGTGEPKKVGYCHAVVFPEPGDASPQEVWIEADGTNSDCGVFATAFYGEGGPMNESTDGFHASEVLHCNGVLYIQYVWVDPSVRGRDVGLQIIRTLGAHFPFHHIALMPQNETPASHRKLWQYWSKLGFNSVEGSFLWENRGLRSDFQPRG